MRVLSIDTAGPVVGVALFVDGSVWQRTERVIRGADTRLMPWAQELAAEAGMSLATLDGVAVGAGPGAFTGLRVGLASALGLATALARPVVPLSTLRTRADRWLAAGQVVVCSLDARKGRLYAARWQGHDLVVPAADIPPDDALRDLAPGFLAVGEGALAYRDAMEAAGGTVVADADDPGLDALARLGAVALEAGQGQDPVDVRPTYLRAPDAKPRRSR